MLRSVVNRSKIFMTDECISFRVSRHLLFIVNTLSLYESEREK